MIASGGVGATSRWQSAVHPNIRDGPRPRDPPVNDQTVFVRGFKMYKRPFRKSVPAVLRAAAEPRPPGPHDPEHDSPGLHSHDSGDSEDTTEDEDGEELTPAVDAAILRTLARIKKKDPAIYDHQKSISQGASKSLSLIAESSKNL